jgi:dCMP deaminase
MSNKTKSKPNASIARPSKEEYYLNIAREVSKRTTCMSIQFGSIIVKDDQIIATGYVGAPRKTKDCLERGNCLRRELGIPSGQRYELCRSVHAEMNAIINAARAGVSLLGGDLYLFGKRIFGGEDKLLDMVPCFICKKVIINAGIKRCICSTADGAYRIFLIEDWTKEWQEKDMINDVDKYDAGDYNQLKARMSEKSSKKESKH